MRISKTLVAAVLALGAGPARADVVDATSTTLLLVGEQTRGGLAPQTPELLTVAPVFEILTISARDLTNPVADDLSIVLQTWGSYELGEERRWDNGTTSDLTGDVVTGYIQGKLLDRHLTLRLGRGHVFTGAGRGIQLDGGEIIGQLPFGLRLSAYAGAPVSQRFATRRTIRSWNPVGGDLAYGGRVAFAYGLAGYPGRGLELGASANFVQDGDDPVREEAAADLRFQPYRDLTFTALGAYSIYDEEVSEGQLRVSYSVTRRLFVEADARYVRPDLLLSRNSILSVFAAENQQQYGAAFTYALFHGLRAGAAYHLVVEPGETEDDGSNLGHEAEASLEWERGRTTLGADVSYLDALENGYTALRVFGRQDYGRFFAAADVLGHLFREELNGEETALTGTLTAGVNLTRNLSAVVSGRAGVTPFLEQAFDVMAKLVYNATYRVREVR
jgi:hypothetical protein